MRKRDSKAEQKLKEVRSFLNMAQNFADLQQLRPKNISRILGVGKDTIHRVKSQLKTSKTNCRNNSKRVSIVRNQ